MFEQAVTTFLVGVVTAAVAVIGKALIGFLGAQKKKAEEETNNEVILETLTTLEAGVAKTEKDFVEGVKAASADGKLTKEEMKQAEDMAKQNAIEIALQIAPAAANLLVKASSDMISGLIKLILGKQKQAEAK